MPKVQLPKTGLNKNSFGDLDWSTDLPAGFDELERRISKSTSGDPTGQISGDWIGQPCWDIVNSILYFCVKRGAAKDAQWKRVDPYVVPPGTVEFFLRANLPSGWLPFDGVTRLQSDFPNLAAVLPASLKDTGNFTLPLVQGIPLSLVKPDNVDLGKVLGTVTIGSTPVESGTPGHTVSVQSGSGATVASSIHTHDVSTNFKRLLLAPAIKT